jgi:hypothetical protein
MTMNKLFVALVLVLGSVFPSSAATSLWTVRTETSTLYLGGTIHLLRPSDYPLPPEYDAAYAAAPVDVFEADPGTLASPEAARLLAEGARYPEGKTLKSELKPETYALLKAHCEKAGLPLESLERLRPAMVALTLLSAELQRLGVSRQGVDFHFYERAAADGKEIGELESAGEQVAFLLGLAGDDPDRFLRLSLRDLERSEEILPPLLAAWRSGDTATLDRELVVPTREEFPDLYRVLFVERNAAWLPQIEALLRTPEAELVLVGVAHLVGRDGLLEALRRRGYAVEPVRLAPEPLPARP